MSVSSEDAFSQDHITMVLEMAREPSYVSEIARKLGEYADNWGLTGTASVERVAIIISMIEERDTVTVFDVGYGSDESGQAEASPIESLTGQGDEEGYRWNSYTLVHYTNDIEIRESFQDVVDPSISPEEKAEMIEMLSGEGNKASRLAEEIMQDVMERQFRNYDITEKPDYNDPGVDFYVEDEFGREWGLAIEISTRWVNPIGRTYMEEKLDKAMERDADLLIVAPRFTKELIREYEYTEEGRANEDPIDQLVHLHTVPTMVPNVYQPFAMSPDEINDREPGGNPVVVSDFDDVRDRLETEGRVGGDYPVVEDTFKGFVEHLDDVHRDFTVITESMYRNEIREAVEPLLWEFIRPYQVEQFLQDTYWEKLLDQAEIAEMVDRGAGAISTAMQEWDVPRRRLPADTISDETVEIWARMYEGKEPFVDDEGNPVEHSGYRVLAEYNRHPLWDLNDWEQWYSETTDSERQEVLATQSSYRDNLTYTLMFNPRDRLLPSYDLILSAIRDIDGGAEDPVDFEVNIRAPDEGPRAPYNAYPSKKALEYMINKDETTIVEVREDENNE